MVSRSSKENTTLNNIATTMLEDTYLKVMRLLQENPDLTQREFSEQLGVSLGNVNYCLKALMEKGLVKMRNFIDSKNKLGDVYVLTPKGIVERAELTSKFLVRKVVEYETLKHEIEVLKAEVDSKKETEQKRPTS